MSSLVTTLNKKLASAESPRATTCGERKNEYLLEKLNKKKRQLRNNRWKRKNLEIDLNEANVSIEHHKSIAKLHHSMAAENKRHLDAVLSLYYKIENEKTYLEKRIKPIKYIIFDDKGYGDSDSEEETEKEKDSVSEPNKDNEESVSEEEKEDDTSSEYSDGVPPTVYDSDEDTDNDVTTVMQQAGVTRKEASEALRKENGDIINAIMSLSGVDKPEDVSKIRAETASGSSLTQLVESLNLGRPAPTKTDKLYVIPKYQRSYVW